MVRRRRPIVLTSAVALLAAGCGAAARSPGIASVAGTTTAASTTTQSGAAAGPNLGGGRGGRFQLAMKTPNATVGAKFSACMRKHGVTNFPDPNSQGVISFGSSSGIDPGSPTFTTAQNACQKLLPNGGRPTPAQQAQMQQKLLALSKCMRAHGIKDFPDPSNGGLKLSVHPGSDLAPQNPQFQAAQKACQGDLPFKAAGAAGGK
jgi:hypothetical protein